MRMLHKELLQVEGERMEVGGYFEIGIEGFLVETSFLELRCVWNYL